MKRAIIITALGITLGLLSATAMIWTGGDLGGITIGPWATPLDAGGTGRGIYTRAIVAVRATLGLSRRETIYFAASKDSAGAALTGNCTYHLYGPDLPSRWWSITLYGRDHYLIANAENRYSFASANIQRAPGGDIDITLAPHQAPGNWLDTASAPHLVLLARLYQPSDAAAANPAGIALPSIAKTGCV